MRHKNFSYAKYGYIFALPFIVTFALFSLYPLVYTVVIAFSNSKGLVLPKFEFLPNIFDNFKSIIGNKTFRKSIGNTFILWIVNFIPQMFLALLLTAWFTSRNTKIRGQGVFKVLFYMPNIITASIIALLFYQLFMYPIGPVNSLLISLGVEGGYDFLRNILPSRLIISFIQFWMWYGYTMLILISGVLGLNPEMYESSEIDGANGIQQFFFITLPNLRTIMLYTLVTSLIGGLNIFDIPKLFNAGYPDGSTETAGMFIYDRAFKMPYAYNEAAAASLIIFLIIAVLSIGLFIGMRDKDLALRKKQERAAKRELKERGAK